MSDRVDHDENLARLILMGASFSCADCGPSEDQVDGDGTPKVAYSITKSIHRNACTVLIIFDRLID
jgi:hypothetical protein